VIRDSFKAIFYLNQGVNSNTLTLHSYIVKLAGVGTFMSKETKRKIASAIIITIGIFWMINLYDTFATPCIFYLNYLRPYRTAFMREYDGENKLRYKWTDLKNISVYLRQAVVLAEDDKFYSHSGFDWEAIKKAAEYDLKKKRLARGASTITQQLAKNLYLSSTKNPLRKIKEFFIALKLERELPKDRILEIYLNVVEWGDGIYGAEAAARHYFGGNAVNLGKHEAAFLAAILPKPRFYDKHRGGPYLTRRIASIESRL